ncbi:contact-dependent growth inhibition system immunity protein [Rhodopila sp.]|uniref:contact-dependent growth inhibition system immunity protein n=1 Tax=Rhodopila sp. TaxID=2480087 RepID=UPI003D0A9471
MAATCFALRQKPLSELTNEEIRVGLEQHVGVEYLAPLAVKRLEIDPLVEARLYRGDLLESLLNVPVSYWDGHTSIREETAGIAAVALKSLAGCSDFSREEIFPVLRQAHDRFTGKCKSRDWIRSRNGKVPPGG